MKKSIKMRLGDEDSPSQDKENRLKEFAKDKTVDKVIDIAIDRVADVANISMPLSMLETFINLIKLLEKSLNDTEQIQHTRSR